MLMHMIFHQFVNLLSVFTTKRDIGSDSQELLSSGPREIRYIFLNHKTESSNLNIKSINLLHFCLFEFSF